MKQVTFGKAFFLFISLLIQHGSIGAMEPSQRQIIQFNTSQPAITCSMYAIEHYQGQNVLIRPAAIEPTPLKKTAYSCKECPKKFIQKGSLTSHIKRIHLGEKSHSCKECGESFFEKKSLIMHNMIHTGEKPFTCTLCNEKFRQKAHLKVHNRTHSKEKPYHCDICPKSFSQPSNLATHKRTHSKEKPFTCTLCDKSYDDQSNYNRHMKSKTHEEKTLETEDPEIIDFAEIIHNENMFTITDNEPFNNPFPEIAFFQLDL